MDVDPPDNNASSPMGFPSSSPRTVRPPRSVASLRTQDVSSPLRFSSSPRSAQRPRNNNSNPLFNPPSAHSERIASRLSSEPLFFSDSSTRSPSSQRAARRRQIRGDIHSSLVPSTPSNQRRTVSHANGSSTLALSSEMDADVGSGPALTHSQPNDQQDDEPRIVFWGTSVSLEESMSAFKEFLIGFKVKYRHAYDSQHGHTSPSTMQRSDGEMLIYQDYLRTMRLTSQTNLNLDMTNLAAYPATAKLERWLRNYPQEVVPMCDQVLKDCVIDLAIEDSRHSRHGPVADEEITEMEGRTYKIRPFGGSISDAQRGLGERSTTVNMRELNPGDIDKLVSIKGLVIRTTPVIPDMKIAFFRCLACSHTVTVEIDRGRIAEPDRCPRDVCNLQGSMSLIHNRCEFADRQVIRLQETPDAVPDGQTPHTVSLCVYDELVDICKPGDRITVTGIFRSVPVRVNPRQHTIKSLFKTYIDVLHVKRSDSKRLGVDRSTREDENQISAGQVGVGGDDDEFDEQRELELQQQLMGATDQSGENSRNAAEAEERLRRLGRRVDIYDLLARSVAPSIWEMDDIKKGVLLQMFGGTNKSLGSAAGGPRYRGDINVLLVGDPGTAKSQILQYAHKIAPRGVYTSGKGSSAVGLTAYVTRDPDTKQLVLESGALVLSDGGICCIDEFDKMSDSTRSVLHEVMEQQTVSIAKAGIITTLNARTSVLAAANPVGSRYNLDWPITKNIDLPPTLISRFDLLYLVLDRIDEMSDLRLAKHLVGMYLEDRPDAGTTDEILPIETLTAYISYARNHINPQIDDSAEQTLVAKYLEMRKGGYDSRSAEKRITATTRQLESMIRLAEAHARMRLSEKVEASDVEEAHRLIKEALKDAWTDPKTGLIDMEILLSGQSSLDRKLREDLSKEIFKTIERIDRNNQGARWTDVYNEVKANSSIDVATSEFTQVVTGMSQNGVVRITGEGDRRIIYKLGTLES